MNADVTKGLNARLSDCQVLYQKLRNDHGNVTGPMFFELHQKLEELYEDAPVKVDELAERILASGGKPVATWNDQLALAGLP